MRVTTYAEEEVQVLEPAVRRRDRPAQGIRRGDVIRSRSGRGPCWQVVMIDARGLPYCENLETGRMRVLSRPEHYVVVDGE